MYDYECSEVERFNRVTFFVLEYDHQLFMSDICAVLKGVKT